MDELELVTLEIDFDDVWVAADGTGGGWLYWEKSPVTTGQHILAVDRFDLTKTAVAQVAGKSEYVTYLRSMDSLPAGLPAHVDCGCTAEESSL